MGGVLGLGCEFGVRLGALRLMGWGRLLVWENTCVRQRQMVYGLQLRHAASTIAPQDMAHARRSRRWSASRAP